MNDRQKLAVKRALQSESIFLLQGPPGTGKNTGYSRNYLAQLDETR
ncbi:MAG: AAA domain-containing protein [Bacilli bacterium]